MPQAHEQGGYLAGGAPDVGQRNITESTAAVRSAVVITAMPGGPANRAGIGYENLWIVLRVAEMLAGKVSNLRLEPLGRAGAGIELTVVVEGVSWGEQTSAPL